MLIVCFGDIVTMILNRVDKTLEKKIKLVKAKWMSYYVGKDRKNDTPESILRYRKDQEDKEHG